MRDARSSRRVVTSCVECVMIMKIFYGEVREIEKKIFGVNHCRRIGFAKSLRGFYRSNSTGLFEIVEKLPIVHVFLGGIIQNDYGELWMTLLEKFSLQDWVTRRAANQTGGMASRVSVTEAVQPVSVKRAVNGDDDDGLPHLLLQIMGRKTRCSYGPMVDRDDGLRITKKRARTEWLLMFLSSLTLRQQRRSIIRQPCSATSNCPPLSDLGERLRQSERKNVKCCGRTETFRKLIAIWIAKNTKI